MKDNTRKILEEVLEQKKAIFVNALNEIKRDIEKTIDATNARWLISTARIDKIGERATKLAGMLQEIRDVRADLREREAKPEAGAPTGDNSNSETNVVASFEHADKELGPRQITEQESIIP